MFAGRYASYLYDKSNPKKEENISIGIPELNDSDNTKQQTNVIKENWDKYGNIYYTNETGDNVLPENKLSPAERLNRVIESRMANVKRRIEETNPYSSFDIKQFHILNNSKQEFLIGSSKNSNKYYLSKITGEPIVRPSRVGISSPYNIISNIFPKFNPKNLINLMKQIFSQQQ